MGDIQILIAITTKLSEENTGVNLCNLKSSNGFLDITPKAQLIIEEINWTTQNYNHVCRK